MDTENMVLLSRPRFGSFSRSSYLWLLTKDENQKQNIFVSQVQFSIFFFFGDQKIYLS